MGFFRFYNLNTVYRTYISRFHSYSNKNVHLYPHNRMIQALSSLLYQHHPLIHDSPNYKIPKRWHVGHSHHHDRLSKKGEKIFRLGLAAGKALTGYLSRSTTVIADAAHSISDVVLSGVALVAMLFSA